MDSCPTLTLWNKRKIGYGNIWPEIYGGGGGQIISIDENSMTAELINRRRSKVSSILIHRVTAGGTSPTTPSPTPVHRLPVSRHSNSIPIKFAARKTFEDGQQLFFTFYYDISATIIQQPPLLLGVLGEIQQKYYFGSLPCNSDLTENPLLKSFG